MSQGTTKVTIPDGMTLERSGNALRVKDAGVLPAKLTSSLLSGLAKNLIINGDFDIWQRGTSYTNVPSNTFVSDRWRHEQATTGTYNVTREADVPTVGQSGHLSSYSLKIAVTGADASVAATDNVNMYQRIEGYNFKRVAQRQFTLSFWVKSNKPGTYCVSLGNVTAGWFYVSNYVINSSATWEKKTVVVQASPSSGTWDLTNGLGLQVRFTHMCGSTYQGSPADTWIPAAGASRIATSSQTNLMDTIGNYWMLSQVQLEDGPSATDFESRAYEQELSLCERYCQVGFTPGTTYGYPWGYMNAPGSLNTVYFQKMYLRTTMRAAPTFDTKQNGSETLTSFSSGAPGANAIAIYSYVVAAGGNYLPINGAGTFGFGAYAFTPESFNPYVYCSTYFTGGTANENIFILLGSSVIFMLYAEL